MNLFSDIEKDKLPFILPQKDGYSYTFDKELNVFNIKVPHGELIYAQCFFDKDTSDKFMNFFLADDNKIDWKKINWRDFEQEKLQEINFTNILWQHDKIKMFGKEVYLPRFSAWYGDDDKPYKYSGLQLQPKPWNKGLMFIKNKIDKIANIKFNSVLLNWYRDGNDHISWHKDAEKELGPDQS